MNLVVVLGPTASGKTKLAVRLAEVLNGEIISADSRQVYKGMDIGTGKDLGDYGDVPYHLIDVAEPGEEFNLFQFQRLFYDKFEEIRSRGKMPVMAGGTGLYLEAILQGYRMAEVPENPSLRAELEGCSFEELEQRLRHSSTRPHNTTDLLDRSRLVRAIEIAEHKVPDPEPLPEIRPVIFGIRWPRDLLKERITKRLKERLEQGMVEEVLQLHQQGISYEKLEFFGLEYRFVSRFLKKELNKNDMFQKLKAAIHDFAKRQETWFRRMERNGIVINWLDGSGDPPAVALKFLNELEPQVAGRG